MAVGAGGVRGSAICVPDDRVSRDPDVGRRAADQTPPGRLGGDCTVVEQGLGLRWDLHEDPYGHGFAPLVALALRDNPLRAQLVVSTVLGKHLPVAPSVAIDAAERLAALVTGDGPFAVLGFCETATSLGHLVATVLDAPYAHTTRRPDPAVPVLVGFQEEHSHAAQHWLQPGPGVFEPGGTVVLVDDELSTGRTAQNTIAALAPLLPDTRFVVATLLDLRPRTARRPDGLDVVALAGGSLVVPEDVMDRARDLRSTLAACPPAPVPTGRGAVTLLDQPWDAPLGGRTGTTPADLPAQRRCLADTASALDLSGGPVLVLGTEELMWAPLQLAALLPGAVFHSTTRSPVLPARVDGYAVRRAVTFPAPDSADRLSRLHGLPDEPYADIVVMTDTAATAAAPLAEELRPWAYERVHVVGV